MVHPLGWDLPAGAANDKNAPFNEPPTPECYVCGDESWEVSEDALSGRLICSDCLASGPDPDQARKEAMG